MSQAIKNVAIIGATGAAGTAILERLVASQKFNITVLRRLGSKSVVPAGLTTKDVDVDSVEALTKALAGQDAVVSAVASEVVSKQTILFDAAIAAGVKRFLPSDFGCDLENELNKQLPVFSQKIALLDYIREKTKTSSITWTSVANNAFLDWGLEHDFIIKTSDSKPFIIDGGDNIFSATSLDTIGDAVVGILLKPEETKNRTVYIDDLKTTQNRLVELAKQVAPNRPWEITHVNSEDLVTKANARLAQGLFDAETFVPYIYRSAFSGVGGANFTKTDNELLGLKGKTEEDILAIFRTLLK